MNGVTAVLVVGETAAPGIIGVVFLGDKAEPGLEWLAVVGFIGAVVGAVLVAYYSSDDADHFGEAPPTEGGWRRRSRDRREAERSADGGVDGRATRQASTTPDGLVTSRLRSTTAQARTSTRAAAASRRRSPRRTTRACTSRTPAARPHPSRMSKT